LNRPWQYYAENVGAFDGVAEITINDAAMEVFPVAIEVKKAAGGGGEVSVWEERVSWISHTNLYANPEEWRAFNARCEEEETTCSCRRCALHDAISANINISIFSSRHLGLATTKSRHLQNAQTPINAFL
jgi:hypothetical protein